MRKMPHCEKKFVSISEVSDSRFERGKGTKPLNKEKTRFFNTEY